MSDTHRRYRAIKQTITQFYHPRPTGHRETHLTTLMAWICGLTGGKHAHLPTSADYAPAHGATQERLITHVSRCLQNDRHTVDGWFLPVAEELLKTLARQPIQRVMDWSVAGRGCLALMRSVVYHGCTRPPAAEAQRGSTARVTGLGAGACSRSSARLRNKARRRGLYAPVSPSPPGHPPSMSAGPWA
jgi:hypothetical protein